MSGKHNSLLAWTLFVAAFFFGAAASVGFQDTDNSQPKPVKRAKRPKFNPREWQGTYFDNLFNEGLVGERPTPEKIASTLVVKNPQNPGMEESSSPSSTDDTGGWVSIIGGDVLENEVKRVQIALEQQITTHVKFQTDYVFIRQSFGTLSMWMAIISQYPENIRWKEYAKAAQKSFAKTAANCRVTSEQAFQGAKLAQDQLRELVRGGTFSVSDVDAEEFSWATTVDRIIVMKRLEESLNKLKQYSGSKETFASESEEVLHEASLTAAMATVIGNEKMEGAEEEDYVKFAQQMLAASKEVRQAVQLQNFDVASAAVNKLEQSCNDCHEEWR